MNNFIKRIFLKILGKGYISFGILFDIFRKGNGLIKRKVGNHLMFLDLYDSGISRTLIRMKPGDQDREPAFMSILRNEAKEGMVALDLGANIGYVTLILAEIVGKRGHVYALEPVPRNFEILSKNVEINNYNDRIEVFQLAGSNQCGELKFYLSDKSNLGSMSKTVHTGKAIDVPIITMDEFFKGKPAPNFIKMDIEGHEVEALEGMFQTLEKAESPMKILMEVHPMYYTENQSLEKQLRKLISIGFHTKYVISAGLAKPDFFIEHGYEPTEVFHMGKLHRGIYTNISDEHMLIAACRKHKQFNKNYNKYVNSIVRSILIER